MTRAKNVENLRASDGIVEVLVESGIDTVFGMPGGDMVGSVYDALYDHRERIRTVLVPAEVHATIMAEAYGRLTGRPGVAIGQGAFMLSTAGVGILEAKLSSSPVVVLADLTDGSPFSQHAPYQSGIGSYGTWDAAATATGLAKSVFVATNAREAVHYTQLAVKHALGGQPGPVLVLFHSTALKQALSELPGPRIYATDRYLGIPPRQAEREQLGRAVELVSAAHRPVILAGNGVRVAQASRELAAFAEALEAPVATTSGGKGVFAEDHRLALGVVGPFGLAKANDAVGGADLIIVVGSKLGASDTANASPQLIDPTRQKMIQIDVEPMNAGWTFPVDLALIADAKAALRQLSDELHHRAGNSRDLLRSATRVGGREPLRDDDRGEQRGLPSPEMVVRTLRSALPANCIATCDAGENRLFMLRYFETRDGGGFLQPCGVGGMGYGIPAALAAKLVYRDRAVVAVCGDGGFALAMSALITAKREGLNIVVVILNNDKLGWVFHSQASRPIASELGRFDYAAAARGLGCSGIRVDRGEDLSKAFAEALVAETPTVLDVGVSTAQTYLTVKSPLADAMTFEGE